MGAVLVVIALAVVALVVGVGIAVLIPAHKPQKRAKFTIACNACRAELGPFYNMPERVNCPHCHAIFTPPEVAAAHAWPQVALGLFLIVVSFIFLVLFLG